MRLINLRPRSGTGRLLALLPFVCVLLAYLVGSSVRLAANASDKLLPAFASFADAINRMAFTADPRTGDVLMLHDTLASLERLLAGLAIATMIAVVLGVAIGLVPYLRALLGGFVAAFSMVPPLAILPILFITVGLGEAAKITLIAIGVAPPLVRDMALRVEDIPRQQIVKAETLGASTWTIILRLVLPQMLPRLLDSIRLQLGPAWLFLIAAEAIAAEAGLGYRIFLVRRYLAMDVILPYVAWITFLAFLMDVGLVALQRRAFPLVRGREGVRMSLISVRNVWKEYDDTVVLEQINLEIAQRAFVALVGPSGCGKTTFLKMLLSEERPSRGVIELDGAPISPEPTADRGVVFQRYSVFPHLTVLGNVLVGAELQAKRGVGRFFGRLSGRERTTATEEARALIASVGLAQAETKYPTQLSGGMQQRLALAQAIMGRPKVLLLDEPFGALDPGIRADIHVLMRKLWNERPLTVVMVTHDLSEAFSLATRVIAFERRRNEPSDGGRFGATVTRDFEVWPKRTPAALGDLRFPPGRDDPKPPTATRRDDPVKTGDAA